MSPQYSPPDPAVHKSLGLNALIGLLQARHKYHILDLGQALGINVEFWSRFRCRIYVEDFYRSFRARMLSGPEKPLDSILAEILPFSSETSFDIILIWDLVNYLELEETSALIRRLAWWSRPGALLFALISSLPQIPAEPILFKIIDTDQMIYETRTQATRPGPRLPPRDIARLMSPFAVSSSFLLRDGIQEYVFSFKNEPRK